MELPDRHRRVGRPLAKSGISGDRAHPIGDAAAFGALVRAERVARGMPQGELAARLGVSRGLLAGLERGDRGVRLDLALQVLTDLGVTLVARPSSVAVRASAVGEAGPGSETAQDRSPSVSGDDR